MGLNLPGNAAKGKPFFSGVEESINLSLQKS